MPLIQWEPAYSVNVAQIDRQHRKLVDLFNRLHDAITLGRAGAVIDKVLTQLVLYTVYHFGAEEALLEKHGYVDAAAHKASHDALTKRAMALKDKVASGSESVPPETLEFLGDWLRRHILEVDRKYAEFLNAKGVR